MIACVAIVGHQNSPLYLRTWGQGVQLDGEAILRFHYIVHCSLDAVEERVLSKKQPGEVPDTYLGLLYPAEEYKVYGYLSNTNTKFIVVLDDVVVKDDVISRLLRRLHGLYVEVFSNPFFALPIASARFDEQVDRAVAAASSGA